MAKQEIIERYIRAVEVSIEQGGSTKFWPFGPGQTDYYFNDILAVNIFEKFKGNPDKFKRALSLLSSNILRWFLLPFTILGLKIAGKDKGYKAETSEMITFIETVWEVLKNKVSSDPFCLDGKNRILSGNEINRSSENLHWFYDTEGKISRHLSIDLESFVWAIDFDIFAYGVFWHGPYSLSNGESMLVKSFIDLDPPFWSLNNPFSNVEIFFVFTNSIDISIDFMSHIDYSKNIWDRLISFAVQADNNQMKTMHEIQKLSGHFVKLRRNQLEKVGSLSPEELIKKSAEIYYYMFRKFFSFYGEGFSPPKGFEKRLKEEGLKYWMKYKSQEIISEEPTREFTRRLYDPRADYSLL